jgi:hypothetical protein
LRLEEFFEYFTALRAVFVDCQLAFKPRLILDDLREQPDKERKREIEG